MMAGKRKRAADMTPEELEKKREQNLRYKSARREELNRKQKEYYAKHKRERIEYSAEWARKNPVRAAFTQQRSAAKQRGVPFYFTFEEWVEWWGDDFEKRGRTADDLCMSRYKDEGPYQPSNCFKQTFAENVAEARRLEAARK
jgi:hypothetical protein